LIVTANDAQKDGQTDRGTARGQKRRAPIEVRVPGTKVHLARDVLDKQLVDWRSEPMGRVDGLVLTVEPGQAPVVTCVESGPVVLARRLHRWAGRFALAVARRWGVRHGRPVRIGWPNVKSVGLQVRLNLGHEQTRALALEDWLREHVIRRIPGSSFKAGNEHHKQ
jgi:hypothetical protein